MDGGPPKDTPQAPQPTTEPTPADKIRAEFDMLPPAQKRELARNLFYGAYELPQGWIEWLDNKLVNPAREAFGDNNASKPKSTITSTTKPQQEVSSPESESGLEDEYVAAVQNISFWGKFPNGLTLRGNQFLTPEPGGVKSDFMPYSPDNWIFNSLRAVPLSFWFGDHGIGSSGGKKSFPNSAFITEEPIENDPNCTAIIFHFNIDSSQKDGFRRNVGNTFISLKLPKTQASALLKTIKSRPDGADIAERFLQKTIPGVLDGDINSPGIKREKTDSLAVLDEQVLRGFFGSLDQIASGNYYSSGSQRQFQDYVRSTLEFKPYSAPVGIITEQATI